MCCLAKHVLPTMYTRMCKPDIDVDQHLTIQHSDVRDSWRSTDDLNTDRVVRIEPDRLPLLHHHLGVESARLWNRVVELALLLLPR